jgi:sugar lactone lactonase YvrE
MGVSVGGASARVLFAAPDRIAVEVPRVAEPGPTPVRAAWSPGATLFVHVGVPMATGLHQVDSPAVDAQGRVYAAFSGPRGQDTPVSVYRVEADGGREPFVEGVVNATSLAFAPSGVLHVSSRYDGVVYRVSDRGRTEPFVSELGVACGLAFAPDGSLFVGDRSGTLHHVSADGLRTAVFETLPASVAAYHLAMGPDDQLYVTGPTLATHDAIYRFDASGRQEVLDRTFGRPQGLAFDASGVLHVVEALAGVSAIYRCPAGGTRRAVVSGPSLVGVAFLPGGDLVAATADTLYRFPSIS